MCSLSSSQYLQIQNIIDTCINYASINIPQNGWTHNKINNEFKFVNEIVLKNKSRLSWSEYGASDGEPVFYFHGVPGSGIEAHPAEQIALDLGIRLIVIDRPGYGNSALQTNFKLLEWPDAVSQLADKLHLKRFSLLGFSGGGMYALACAYKIPERIKQVTLVSSVAPFETEVMQNYINPGFKPLYELSASNEEAAIQQVSQLLSSVEVFMDILLQILPPADKELFSKKHIHKHYLNGISLATNKGVVNDLRNIVMPWQFDLKDIDLPIDIWHGRNDTLVGFAIGEYLSHTLTNSTSHFFDNRGHYFLLGKWQEVLKCFTSKGLVQHEASH